MPGYLRQSEEDLPEAEGQFLGLPDGSIDTDPCHPQPARPRLRQGLSPSLMARGYPFGQDSMDGPYAVTSTLVVRPITRRSSHGEPAASHSGNGELRVAHARPLRRRTAGLGQTSRQYRTGMHGVIEKLPVDHESDYVNNRSVSCINHTIGQYYGSPRSALPDNVTWSRGVAERTPTLDTRNTSDQP